MSKRELDQQPAVAGRNLVREFAWCQQICRRSRSSFLAAFRLLDPARREGMHALYAFARITDDLGDNDRPASDRLRLLDAWQNRLRRLLEEDAGENSPPQELAQYNPLWRPLAHSVHRFSIPLELLNDVVDGVRKDIEPHPPESWHELDDYCYHVASAVGLACVHIWRKPDETTFPTQAAIDCGIAFQLTNILRDVAEDARQGRLYLPLTELDRCRVSQAAWMAGTPDGNWCDLITSVAERAESCYQRGWSTIEHLTPRSQRMFSLMWCSYRTLLRRVVARRRDLWNAQRIRLTSVQRAYLLASHMLSSKHVSSSKHA